MPLRRRALLIAWSWSALARRIRPRSSRVVAVEWCSTRRSSRACGERRQSFRLRRGRGPSRDLARGSVIKGTPATPPSKGMATLLLGYRFRQRDQRAGRL
jgi:hypothetical protein